MHIEIQHFSFSCLLCTVMRVSKLKEGQSTFFPLFTTKTDWKQI